MLAGLIFGLVFYSFFGLLSRKLDKSDLLFYRRLAKFGSIIFPAQFVVGFLLVMQEPDQFAKHHLIWAKFGLFIVAGLIHGLFVERSVKRLEAGQTGAQIVRITKAGLGISVLIYALIIILGVLAAGME